MNRSEQLNELFTALSKAQGEMPFAERSCYNDHFKYYYADITDLAKAARPSLAKYGLSVIQNPIYINGEAFLETVITHSSGQFWLGHMLLNPTKIDIQAMGSFMSNAKRYAYSAITGVMAKGEDDDGEAASKQPAVETLTPDQIYKLELEIKKEPKLRQHLISAYKVYDIKQIPRTAFVGLMKKLQDDE